MPHAEANLFSVNCILYLTSLTVQGGEKINPNIAWLAQFYSSIWLGGGMAGRREGAHRDKQSLRILKSAYYAIDSSFWQVKHHSDGFPIFSLRITLQPKCDELLFVQDGFIVFYMILHPDPHFEENIRWNIKKKYDFKIWLYTYFILSFSFFHLEFILFLRSKNISPFLKMRTNAHLGTLKRSSRKETIFPPP